MGPLSPIIQHNPERKLIGVSVSMTLSEPKTAALWQHWMPRRQEIVKALSNDFISMSLYPADYFDAFHPHLDFEQWAAVEVSDFQHVPEGMKTFVLPAGRYAVFHYKGPAGDASIFQAIFTQWLPASDFVLDHRPHFEVLGEKFHRHRPDSEEEIWIPVQPKIQP